jgi:hypothetical protein
VALVAPAAQAVVIIKAPARRVAQVLFIPSLPQP